MSRYADIDKMGREFNKRATIMTNEQDDMGYAIFGDEFDGIIDDALAEDVAPVIHAHWITINDSAISKSVLCSHCKDKFFFMKKGQLNIDMMPYCPSCGAKMDEVADNE